MYVCGFAFASGAGVQAQSYPSKPIRMIVISSAAGSTDIIARAVGRALGEGMGQSIVLETGPAAAVSSLGNDGQRVPTAIRY
jgi:tripartite-type tricarboxylate transporter receptor subunit TctC